MIARTLDFLIRCYQVCLAPYLGAHCRYQPTCSAYAREAIAAHGAARGSWLAAQRLFGALPRFDLASWELPQPPVGAAW